MRVSYLLALGLLLLGARAYGDATDTEIVADPPSIRLQGAQARLTLLIHRKTRDGYVHDCTGAASFHSVDPSIATVSSTGVVKATADGSTVIEVRVQDQFLRVPVKVEGTTQPRRFNFENDIESLLSRFGCNSAGCHGKAEGQNGFKLSVFGFDPVADYAALTKEARGRRVFLAAPEQSLLLKKIGGGVPHGGGVRIPKGSEDYETIRAWIAAGTPYGAATDPRVRSLRVEPSERIMAMGGSQQLRVIAGYSDGHEADVTRYAKFQSNNEGLATVSAEGLVHAGQAPGDVAIMASYLKAVDTFRTLVPRAQRIDPYPAHTENNFIDGLVFAKLKKL